jgi:hypothetical protein
MKSETSVNVRSVRVRSLVVLPLLAVVGVGISGCDSKVGTAAVVNDQRISEKQLNDYLTPNAQAIPGSQGVAATPARLFVLKVLVRNDVFRKLLDVTGGQPTAAQMTAAKAQLFASGGTEQDLTKQIVQTGLQAKFTQDYLADQTLLTFFQQRISSQPQLDAALKKANLNVSINPRYGGWDATSLSVSDLSKKQLPDAVTLSNALPGDVQQPAAQ